MTDRRGLFTDWVGEAVELSSSGGKRIPEYGVLEDVNGWGLMLRHRRNMGHMGEALSPLCSDILLR